MTVQNVAANNAGIGGNNGETCGLVFIQGCDITVTGGTSAAGIGGGAGGAGNSIYIYKGSGAVTATTSGGGAGIGGGSGGAGGTITINGGAVTATSIGGGNNAAGGTIAISGGTVAATGGIGYGTGGSGGTLAITGGSINANTNLTPTNGSTTIYRNTWTLGSLAAPHALTWGAINGVACNATPDAPNSVYGISDVKTDNTGKLYFWLPPSAGEGLVMMEVNGGFYRNSFTRAAGDASQTLPQFTPPALYSRVGMADGYNYYVLGYSQAGENNSLHIGQAYTAGDDVVTLFPASPADGGPPVVSATNRGPSTGQTEDPSVYTYPASSYANLVQTTVSEYKDNTSSTTNTRSVTGTFHWLSTAEMTPLPNTISVYSGIYWLRTSSSTNSAQAMSMENYLSGRTVTQPGYSRPAFRIKIASTVFRQEQAPISFATPTPSQAYSASFSYQQTPIGGNGNGAITYSIVPGGGGTTAVTATINSTTGTITNVARPGTLVVQAVKAGDINYIQSNTTTYTLTIPRAGGATEPIVNSRIKIADGYYYYVLGYSQESQSTSLHVGEDYTAGDDVITLLPAAPGADGGPPTVTATLGGPSSDYTEDPSVYTYSVSRLDGLVQTTIADYKDNSSSNTSNRTVTGIFHWLSTAENNLAAMSSSYATYWLRTAHNINGWGYNTTIGGIQVNLFDNLSRPAFRIKLTADLLKEGQAALTFPDLAPRLEHTSLSGTYTQTASGGNAGIATPITYSIVSTTIAEASINSATGTISGITHTGTITVKARKEGDATYAAATATYTLTVWKTKAVVPRFSLVEMKDNYKYYVLGYSTIGEGKNMEGTEDNDLHISEPYTTGDNAVTLFPAAPADGGPPVVIATYGGPRNIPFGRGGNPSDYTYSASSFDGLVSTTITDYKTNTSSNAANRTVTGVFHWLGRHGILEEWFEDGSYHYIDGSILEYPTHFWLRFPSHDINDPFTKGLVYVPPTGGSGYDILFPLISDVTLASRPAFRISRTSTSFKEEQAPLTFTNASPSQALSSSFTYTQAATGGTGTGAITYTIASSTAAGASINAATGTISGVTGIGTITVKAQKAGDANYVASNTATYTLTIDKIVVTNTAGSAAVTYADATIDLSTVGGLFSVDGNAGARTYTIEASGSPTGEGTLTNGILTVTKAGTFTIGLATAAIGNYDACAMVTAVLTVGKASQATFAFAAPTPNATYAAVFTYTNTAPTGGTGTGTVTYTIISSTAAGASINATTGEISGITDTGTIQVRATKAATDLYEATTADYTLTVVHKVIDIAAIAGIAIPAYGSTPVAIITETEQYTGTVSWNPNPATFALATLYTATITLTPKTGYTLTGVAANFFTVSGTTGATHNGTTNPAGSNTVTATFPTTTGRAAVINTGGSAAVTYGDGSFIGSGSDIDLSTVSGLFNIDGNAGAATYTMDASIPESAGTISGSVLTVTKAGTFTIGLTTAETFTHVAGGTVTAVLTVNKATLAATVNLAGWTYGSAGTPSVIGNTGSGAPTYYYDATSGGTFTNTTRPTNAGTYYIKATIATTDLYDAFTTPELQFTINKAAAPIITYPTVANTITYGATLSTATLSGGSTEYGTFNWTTGTIVPTVPNTGYQVTFTPSPNTLANYNTITTTTATVTPTVNKAAQATLAFATTAPNATYTAGSTYTHAAPTGGTGTGTVTYTIITGGTTAAGATINPTTGAISGVTSAGTIQVEAQKAGDDNYLASNTATYTLTIAKAAVSNTGGGTATVTYGDASFSSSNINLSGLFTIDGNAGAPTYTINASNPADAGSITGGILTVTKAGSFAIRLVTAATGTHLAGGMVSATLTVNKATQATLTFTTSNPSATYAAGFTYTHAAPTGGSGGGTVTYTIVSSGTTAAGASINATTGEINGVTGTGTVQVRATKAATDLYDEATADYTLTVNPKVIDIAAIAGVAIPAYGNTSVANITETAQYTGTVSWTPSHATFAYATPYTATITLTPKAGYTLTGVAANYFTVAGTTGATHNGTTNPAGSGTVTATFPATTSKAAVSNTAGAATVVYGDASFSGNTLDLSTLATLFTIDPQAGTATYTKETSGTPTGEGTLTGGILTVTKAGTFTIGLATAATGTHAAGGMVTAVLTVNKAAAPIITYPTAANTITYGQPLSASALSGGTTTYGTFNWTTGTTVPIVPNTGYQVTFTPNANTLANYNTITTTTATVALTVTPATLTVTPNAGQSKIIGTPNPAAYTYTTSGWQNGDGASLLSGALDRATGENVGTYAITQGTLDAGDNYTIDFTPGVTFEIKPATSDNTKVSTVAVNGTTLPPGTTNFYLADCGTTSAQITVTPEESTSQVIYDGTPGSTFSIGIARADIHEVTYTVRSTDGSERTYTLQIERRFAFADIVGMKFNNVLYVNNNPANNGGYTFKNYRWFKNGDLIGEEQVYSAGDNSTDLLDPTADYSVEVTTKSINGIAVEKVLHVCPDRVILDATLLRAYPSPAPSGTTVTVESGAADGSVIRIYNMQGTIVGTQTLVGNKSQLSLPPSSGVYLITVDGESIKIKVE
ncbi:T9SS type A sorting domain-containing protein [Candidatus Symbiothrix dinenymphae]|uniref:T9SS type A sorting domain-containing protein n=1 Tax=Candidatus Symbiothrix dinenymphae TaxID=467085 RepID=UPI001D037D89|nr:T9SS type A sorting domain-containing protein [Candidatus Symbiothrix dinenymphae]